MYASVSNVHSSMTNCEVVAHISPPISTENHKLQLPNVHLQVIDINPTSYCLQASTNLPLKNRCCSSNRE